MDNDRFIREDEKLCLKILSEVIDLVEDNGQLFSLFDIACALKFGIAQRIGDRIVAEWLEKK